MVRVNYRRSNTEASSIFWHNTSYKKCKNIINDYNKNIFNENLTLKKSFVELTLVPILLMNNKKYDFFNLFTLEIYLILPGSYNVLTDFLNDTCGFKVLHPLYFKCTWHVL